ncbi:MAG: hypothetical protein ACOYYS_08495 [Chloroflexota bacterium]
MSDPLRIHLEQTYCNASNLRSQGEQVRQILNTLLCAWNRLDTGWESYSESGVQDLYQQAVCELTRMIAMLEQVEQAISKTTDSIHAADESSVALFDLGSRPPNFSADGMPVESSVPIRAYQNLPITDLPQGEPPPGYLDSANVDSVSQERIDDLKQLLATTYTGYDVAVWLDEQDIDVTFGDLPDGEIAHTPVAGSTIILSSDFAGWSDYALAAYLLHEGTHLRDPRLVEIEKEGNAALKALRRNWYEVTKKLETALYPYPEEYRAFKAQADFWLEVRDRIPLIKLEKMQ